MAAKWQNSPAAKFETEKNICTIAQKGTIPGSSATDLGDLLDSEPAFRSGAVALWLAVLIDAFFTLRDGGGYQDMARGWIEDPENLFFEAVADELGYSPDGLRERIREALRRSAGIRRASWQDRLRQRLMRL